MEARVQRGTPRRLGPEVTAGVDYTREDSLTTEGTNSDGPATDCLTAESPVTEGAATDHPATPALPHELVALTAMLGRCSTAGQVELERLLTAKLYPAPTVSEDRLAELLPLAELLESPLAIHVPNHPLAPVHMAQDAYDRVRPAGAPASDRLVERYGGGANGGWYRACRAAWGLMPDGRKRKPGAAWAYPNRGAGALPRSSRAAVLASIRECALTMGRRPSSNTFKRWAEAQRRAEGRRRGARGRVGSPQRVFGMAAVYRHFASWAKALDAARITDAELVAARAARVPGVAVTPDPLAADSSPPAPGLSRAERLAELSVTELDAAGFSESQRACLSRSSDKCFGRLPLSRAAALAHSLGGSLEWLVGMDSATGKPAPAGMRFDGYAFNELRKRHRLREEAVLSKARLSLGRYRGIIMGSTEPTLTEVVALAGLVRSSVARCTQSLPLVHAAAVHDVGRLPVRPEPT